MWRYHNPVQVHCGLDALHGLSDAVGSRRAVLITIPEADELGWTQALGAALGERLAGIEACVQPNPDLRWLAPLYARLWQRHPDAECVIALGGGSAIDCGKALLTATSSGTFTEILDHLRGHSELSAERAKALIALPTTAGTGSEVTPWATLWDAEQGQKHSLHLPWTWPEAAFIDPALMTSLPLAPTRASALDALSHALESIWNIHRNPVSSTFAVAAIQEILLTLPALLKDLGNTALRARLATAALKAGLAFSNTRTALAHSLSYRITLEQQVPHGIACSFSLGHIMRLAQGRAADVDHLLCTAFHSRTVEDAAHKLDRFLAQVGISTQPEDYGIAPSDWARQIAQSLDGPRGRNFIAQQA
ncbi:MAG: iron-containing alcohol dehydrogenase [Pigmentiphaga sp.]|nr:iron-containing alcohol dehydrogenase [Pigmentiphaga sp.]